MASSLSGISRRRLAALTIPVVSLSSVFAQEAVKTGTIEGRIFNATSGLYVVNARVTVEGTSIQAFTNDSGGYELRNVPAGVVKVKVSYTGQQDIIKDVTVAADSSAKFDATFGAGAVSSDGELVLDTYVIETARYRNAQELAINEERVATNIKSVVALDSMGHVADGNIGEFIRYLPGVDLGEGGDNSNPTSATTVGVRGFDAYSTEITVDGMPLASGSPAGLTRAVQLDGISVNNGSRIEIIKVATPDMAQNSPGGVINVVTRGAFESKKPTYDVTVALTGNTNNPDVFKKTAGPSGSVYPTTAAVRVSASVPVTRKFGFSVSASYDPKYTDFRESNPRDWVFASQSTTINGVSTVATNAKGAIRIDNPMLRRFENRDQQWVEDRYSGSIRMDWKPFPELEIRLGGNYSQFESQTVIRRMQWELTNNGRDVLDWGENYVYSRQRTATYTPGLSREMDVGARDKEGFTSQGSLSVAYKKGPWRADLRASASESFHSMVDAKNGHFSTVTFQTGVGRIHFENMERGIPGQILMWDNNGNPIDYSQLSTWGSITPTSDIRSSQGYSRDLKKDYKLDVSRELDFLPFPVTLKAGGNIRENKAHKWGRGEQYMMSYLGPNITFDRLQAEFTTEPGVGYPKPQQWVDPYKLYEFYRQNPQHFSDTHRVDVIDGSNNVDRLVKNYESRVGSAKGVTTTDSDVYGMVTANFFNNRMTVVTGARQSRKEAKGYNVFNDPRYAYARMADGSIYRDSIYTRGVRFDGNQNAGVVGGTGSNLNAPNDRILTDMALRARMQAAGVVYIPDRLELGYLTSSTNVTNTYTSPEGRRGVGTRENNRFFAPLGRYTKDIDTAQTQPWQPQVQVAYDITDKIRAQVAWSKETRLPDLEAAQGLLINGANFQIAENSGVIDPSILGSDGTIRISNVKNTPEINYSYNAKLSYYPSWGRYSISYYYKYVENTWLDETIYNDDPLYDEILASLELDPASYDNYAISTVTLAGDKTVRKGFELEAYQNLGFLGRWAKNLDFNVTYTRRPSAQRSANSALGYTRMDPVRAKYSGQLTYSASRFSFMAKYTFVEHKRTRQSEPTVTMPDGTSRTIALYNRNINPATISLQATYVINKNYKFFITGNKILEGETQAKISDVMTGYMPEYSHWKQQRNRGVAITAGVTASF